MRSSRSTAWPTTHRVPSNRMDGISFISVATNGIELSVAQAGPADGPLVILLHGFPEFWYGLRQADSRLSRPQAFACGCRTSEATT